LAVKNSCARCGKRFSAPENYLGKKIDCPRCGHRTVLRTPDEEREIKEREEQLRRTQKEDRRKLDLIERAEQKNRRLQASRPYYEKYQTGLQAVRHHNPNAPSRFVRLRALSDLLILSAYLTLMLVLVGAGLTVYLQVEGGLSSLPLLLLCLVGWALLGTVLYVSLKYLGELAFVLADMGDQQNEMVQLLLDLRENTDGVDTGVPEA